MDNTWLKIGELAAFYNVSVKALRLYEKKRLIRPVHVDPLTGYRFYSVDQVSQVRVLLELKSLGFSLGEIEKILSGKWDGKALCEALKRKRMAWRDAISVAENKIDAIDGMLSSIKSQGGLPDTSHMTEEERAWVLSQMACVEDVRASSAISDAIWL